MSSRLNGTLFQRQERNKTDRETNTAYR